MLINTEDEGVVLGQEQQLSLWRVHGSVDVASPGRASPE